MITIKQLKFALAVADTKHFKKASENCSVSQSALSTAISELEKNLGVQIFERDNKRVLITATGEKILRQAQHICTDVDDLIKSAQSHSAPLVNPMNIGFIPSIAPYLLPKVMPSLRSTYPQFKLSITEDLSSRLVSKVRSGELDAAVLALPYPIDGLHAFSFWEEDFYAVFHKTDLAANKSTIDSKSLVDNNLMLLGNGHCLRDHVIQACELNNDIDQNTFKDASLNTLIQMALSSMGTTLVPQIALDQIYSQNKDIKALHLDAPSPHRTIAVVTRLNYSRVNEIKLLTDLFTEQLKLKWI